MRKRATHRQSHAAVYQPSDAVSVLAIAITAIILVLSLFAMERFAGVPVSVRGEPIYSEPIVNHRTTTIKRQSLAAQRAAARRAARTAQTRTTSSSSSANTSGTCENTACANLISKMLTGDPACMKEQACVDSVYRTISQFNCRASSSCTTLSNVYGFFYANQSCVTNFTSACKSAVEATIKR